MKAEYGTIERCGSFHELKGKCDLFGGHHEPHVRRTGTGALVEWTNEETRTGTLGSTEGVKSDGGKARWDLLPFDALDDVAAVLRYGADKYAPRNWEKGMAWGRLLAAALRHLAAWATGEDSDAESGQRHLAHAACCVLMLLALTKREVGTDDRVMTR